MDSSEGTAQTPQDQEPDQEPLETEKGEREIIIVWRYGILDKTKGQN